MEDIGSMIIGFVLAFLSVRFIADPQAIPKSIYVKAAPVIAVAVFFLIRNR